MLFSLLGFKKYLLIHPGKRKSLRFALLFNKKWWNFRLLYDNLRSVEEPVQLCRWWGWGSPETPGLHTSNFSNITRGKKDMFKQKKIVTLLASVGLVASFAVSTQVVADSHDMKHYALDGAKTMVKDGSGNCVNTVGGAPGPQEACGDAMPMEEVEVDGDSDGDGVPDSQDKCPGTRAGAEVDQWGCEVVGNLTIDLVEGEFAFDSAVLTPAMETTLTELADRIKASAGHEVVTITGHTDSVGPEDYNQGLSERRAQSAADYLESQGIDSITTKGEGETNPVADNGTREGRAQNRRIEVETH